MATIKAFYEILKTLIMEPIKPQTVWIKTEGYHTAKSFHVEEHKDMIVLTKEEFEKVIKDAKAEELKRIRDIHREVDEDIRRTVPK